jgi:hypothetical protein
MGNNLTERAMLVSVSMSAWRGTKVDKSASREICETKNAKSDSARVYKRLVDRESLSEITRLQTQARSLLYEMTLPWLDNGVRVLPSKLFFDFQDRMDDIESQHTDAVERFLENYDNALVDSMVRLGEMFNPAEYPTADQLRAKFSLKTTLFPVPDGDFRVQGVDTSELEKKFQQQADERQAEMVKDLARRMAEISEEFASKVNSGKRFWDSLMTKVGDLGKLVDGLNMTDDPAIAEAGKKLVEIGKLRAEDIRDDKQVKAKAIKQADEVRKVASDLANIF